MSIFGIPPRPSREGKMNDSRIAMIVLAVVCMMIASSAVIVGSSDAVATDSTDDTETTGPNDNEDTNEDPVAKVGDKTYGTLKDAVEAIEGMDAKSGTALKEPTTIELLRDVKDSADFGSADGTKAVNVILDLNGHTLTLGPGIGSTGTETNGIRVLAYSALVVKDGNVIAGENESDQIKVAFANYGYLCLDNVDVDVGPLVIYTINNSGILDLQGSTFVEAGGNANPNDNPELPRCAIILSTYQYVYTGTHNATINCDSPDVSVGNIVIEPVYNGNANENGVMGLNITAGQFGGITWTDSIKNVNVEGNISGGVFENDVSEFLAPGVDYVIGTDGNMYIGDDTANAPREPVASDDDDEFVPPYIPQQTSNDDDTTLYIACCAAAAVVALLAIIIVMNERKR